MELEILRKVWTQVKKLTQVNRCAIVLHIGLMSPFTLVVGL